MSTVHARIRPRQLYCRVSNDNIGTLMAMDGGLDGEGRIPNAWLTFGNVSGTGWGFLPPWCQQAMGRHDRPGEYCKWRLHAPFIILKLRSFLDLRPHFFPTCQYGVYGRFYKAIVWRKGLGWRYTDVD